MGAAAGGVPLQTKEQMDIMMDESFKTHKADVMVAVGESIKVLGESIAFATGKHLATMNNDIVQQINQANAAFKDNVHMAVDGKIDTAVNDVHMVIREREKDMKKMYMQVEKMQKELNNMKKTNGNGTTSGPVAKATSVSAASGSNGAKEDTGKRVRASADTSQSNPDDHGFQFERQMRDERKLPPKKRTQFTSYADEHWKEIMMRAPADTFVWTSDIIDLLSKQHGIKFSSTSTILTTACFKEVNRLMDKHFDVRPSLIRENGNMNQSKGKLGFRGFTMKQPGNQ